MGAHGEGVGERFLGFDALEEVHLLWHNRTSGLASCQKEVIPPGPELEIGTLLFTYFHPCGCPISFCLASWLVPEPGCVTLSQPGPL
jgi:hypothetical protein